jgi:hypothetical protein
MQFRRSVKVLTISSLMLSAVGAANAANLTSVQGQVQISRAGGPFVATGVTVVNPGDVVQALAGGSAQVVYADGQVTPVYGGASVRVAPDRAAVLAGPSFQGAPGAGAAAAGSATAVSTTALVVGGVVAAAGVYAVATKLAEKKPASP